MWIIDKIRAMDSRKRMTAAMTFCGSLGLLLILLSSVIPDKKSPKPVTAEDVLGRSESYCEDTEKRLEDFLGSIDGAGEVRVYLTVGSDERYVYASEGRRTKSENKTEEERKYVMTGSGSEKSPLVETVKVPEVCGAVIACTGGGSPVVRERLYKAVSAALDIPSNKIYVTMLK